MHCFKKVLKWDSVTLAAFSVGMCPNWGSIDELRLDNCLEKELLSVKSETPSF